MWTDKDGKLKSLQTRRYENAKSYLNDLIKNHMDDSGIPKGLRTDFKMDLKFQMEKINKTHLLKRAFQN